MLGTVAGIQRKRGEIFYWGLEIGMGIRKQLRNNNNEARLIFNYSAGLVF